MNTPGPSNYRPNRPARRSDPRRKILAAWRGVDVVPIEQARRDTAQTAGTVVDRVLGGLKLDTRRADAEILKVWNSLIDPTITAHAHPTGLKNGTLFVTVDSNVWLSEIVRYRRREILERLQHSFGRDLIAKISFRAG
ncbi:MAG TPA: DUF721 domain-containing protein [Roseimicrobium sp.]|nr:DUF721 domain-containing protein [Roseimicrobium sp.]